MLYILYIYLYWNLNKLRIKYQIYIQSQQKSTYSDKKYAFVTTLEIAYLTAISHLEKKGHINAEDWTLETINDSTPQCFMVSLFKFQHIFDSCIFSTLV